MVIHWPARINDGGVVRSQFTHCIDIGPTILDIAGIPAATHVDGIEQQPMHGVTFADSIADPAAPERHTQQYFEIVGYRGMYKDGWWLSMMPPRIPWDLSPQAVGRLAPGCGTPRRTLPSSITFRTTSLRAGIWLLNIRRRSPS